jgi:hypothetical protein
MLNKLSCNKVLLPMPIVFTLAFTGCAVVPSVMYTRVESPEQAIGVTDSFYLQRSILLIDKTDGTLGDAGKKSADSFSVQSKPAEHTDFKIGIRSADGWGVKTNVNITKQNNTDLVASIGIETIDNRMQLIGQVGGILVKLLPLVGALQEPPPKCDIAFPLTINLPSQLPEKDATLYFDGDGKPVDSKGCVVVKIEKAPPDSLKISKDFPFEVKTSNFYYSACRQATIQLIQDNAKFSRTLRISDPMRLQFVQLPIKGAVTMHSECGVSVSTDKDTGVSSGAAIVDALITQAKAIKDARDAAKK